MIKSSHFIKPYKWNFLDKWHFLLRQYRVFCLLNSASTPAVLGRMQAPAAEHKMWTYQPFDCGNISCLSFFLFSSKHFNLKISVIFCRVIFRKRP